MSASPEHSIPDQQIEAAFERYRLYALGNGYNYSPTARIEYVTCNKVQKQRLIQRHVKYVCSNIILLGTEFHRCGEENYPTSNIVIHNSHTNFKKKMIMVCDYA